VGAEDQWIGDFHEIAEIIKIGKCRDEEEKVMKTEHNLNFSFHELAFNI
jgi:hypothetical protein